MVMKLIAVLVLSSACSIAQRVSERHPPSCSLVPLTADVGIATVAGIVGTEYVSNPTSDGVEAILVGVPALVIAGLAAISATVGYATASSCHERRARAERRAAVEACGVGGAVELDAAMAEPDLDKRAMLLGAAKCVPVEVSRPTPRAFRGLMSLGAGSVRDRATNTTGGIGLAGRVAGPLWLGGRLEHGRSSELGAGGNGGPGLDSGSYTRALGTLQLRECRGATCLLLGVGGGYTHRSFSRGEFDLTTENESQPIATGVLGIAAGTDWQVEIGLQTHTSLAGEKSFGLGFASNLTFRFGGEAPVAAPRRDENDAAAWRLVFDAAIAALQLDCSVAVRVAPEIDQRDPTLLARTLLRDVASARCLAESITAAVALATTSGDANAIRAARTKCEAFRVRFDLAAETLDDKDRAARLRANAPRCEREVPRTGPPVEKPPVKPPAVDPS